MKRKGGRRWQILRRRVLDRDGWRCRGCTKAGVLEVDHIKRIEDDGPEFEIENCQTLCRGCHIKKTSAERGVIPFPSEWTALVDDLT